MAQNIQLKRRESTGQPGPPASLTLGELAVGFPGDEVGDTRAALYAGKDDPASGGVVVERLLSQADMRPPLVRLDVASGATEVVPIRPEPVAFMAWLEGTPGAVIFAGIGGDPTSLAPLMTALWTARVKVTLTATNAIAVENTLTADAVVYLRMI